MLQVFIKFATHWVLVASGDVHKASAPTYSTYSLPEYTPVNTKNFKTRPRIA